MVNEEKTWFVFHERFNEFQIMNEIQRAKIILKILNKTYPSIKVPLKSRNVFTLLISVLLSAQCTDVNVNNVTKNIYPKYHKPEHFVKLGRKKIETLIKKSAFSGLKQRVFIICQEYWLKTIMVKYPKPLRNLKNYQELDIKLRV